MKAQDGEDVRKYKLEDILLEYDVIESEALVREVRDQYSIGRSLGYEYVTRHESQNWAKEKTIENISVNIPRKSMKTVVLLFTGKDAGDSEKFPFPGIKELSVSIEGKPNALYSKPLTTQDMHEEAERFFGTMGNPYGDNIPCREFFTNKFSLVIDLRTVDDESVSGSGREILGTQAGIKIEIKKEVTTKDLDCHVFVVADAIVKVVGNKLQDVDYS